MAQAVAASKAREKQDNFLAMKAAEAALVAERKRLREEHEATRWKQEKAREREAARKRQLEIKREARHAGSSRAKSAPRSLRRALLMPQVNTGSLYRRGMSS